MHIPDHVSVKNAVNYSSKKFSFHKIVYIPCVADVGPFFLGVTPHQSPVTLLDMLMSANQGRPITLTTSKHKLKLIKSLLASSMRRENGVLGVPILGLQGLPQALGP